MADNPNPSEGAGGDAGAAQGGDQNQSQNGQEGSGNAGADDAAAQAAADAANGGAPAEPPVRGTRSKESFIIDRKNERISQLEAELAKAGGKKAEDGGSDGADDGANQKINETDVEKILNNLPIIQKIQESELVGEINDFVKQNPAFEPYKDKIVQYAKHPSRSHVPISEIAFGIAGPALLKMGAQQANNANHEAAAGQSGGGSTRDAGMGSTAPAAGTPEFAAWKQRMLTSK